MKVFDVTPTFIVHRAESRNITEELPSSVSWIEIDVRRSSDGIPVVFHDENVDTGERAGSLTYAALRDLGVLALENFLLELPKAVNLVLDVKNSIDDATSPYSQSTGSVVMQAIQQTSPGRSILVTSFDPGIVMRAQQARPGTPVGLTTWQGVPLRESIPTAVTLQADVLAAHVDALSPYGIELGDSRSTLAAHVDLAHRVGLQLACWGAQNLTDTELRYLTELGVDAIYMDERDIRSRNDFISSV